MRFTLILGNTNYSSWSLRGWLLLEAFGIAFEHRVVPLFTDEFEAFRETHSPARQVPTLEVTDGERRAVIWDSLAIAEFLHERHPQAGIWPAETIARAAARSLCAEMHSAFHALRNTMPMNLRRRYTRFRPDAATSADIERIVALWAWARSLASGAGPYLFGETYTAADAFFTPVAARFQTYGIRLDAASAAYRDALLGHPATVAFYGKARDESWTLQHAELDIE